MSLKQALLVGAALALPVVAQAQPVSGFYVGAGAGVNWLQNTDVDFREGSGPLTGGAPRGGVDFDLGWVGVVSVGYGLGNGVRAEAEFSYRQNGVDSVSGFGTSPAGARSSGDVMSYGFMANLLYDFDLGLPVMPYVGAGLGMAIQDYDGVSRNAAGDVVRLTGSDTVFAYQAIVGAAVPLNQFVQGLALTAEYRYFASVGPDITGGRSLGGPAGQGTASVDNVNHSLLIGVRYAFGAPVAPPPVVPPAAAPAPARTFLVFFDFDRADLTDRARQIIAEAANTSRSVQTTRIEVSGHADRAGTPQYNQRLSERRAQAVAAELERQGVPRSAMAIQAFGESRPLVPTADGVREPQNRRVEIVLR